MTSSTNTANAPAVATNLSFAVQYNITDHLGNLRASFNELRYLQENSYNPYGTQSVSNVYSGQPKNNYLFNGKEQQTEIAGFGFYNYGARFYDPALGRWHSIDPLAEKYYSWSPYNFCAGNPLRFVDPDGCEFTENAWEWVNKLIENIDRRQEKNDTKIAKLQSRIDASGSERKINRLNNKIDKLNTNTVEL